MRRRLVRKGLRLILASLILILLVSFYNGELAAFLSFSSNAEHDFYGKGILFAALLGGAGVVVTVSGLVQSADRSDMQIKILPTLIMLICSVALFFYLLFSLLNQSPDKQPQRPGSSISI